MLTLGRGRRSTRAAARRARQLEEEGRSLEAVGVLTEANRNRREPGIERALVRTRNRAFAELGGDEPAPAEAQPEGLRSEHGLPAIDAAGLTAGRIRAAILDRGSLIVRGLVSDGERLAELRDGIDRVFDGRARSAEGAAAAETAPWYAPFVPEPEYETAVGMGRRFVNEGSGVWLADSPRMLFELTETFASLGLAEVIGDYLGERPAISVNKGTLRRARPTAGTEWWHQDGAFLGEGIRSLNVWLALSDCGEHAPGMDVVAKRLDGIVEKGTEGADFDWSVGQPVVDEVAGDAVTRPLFEAGDALLFDHLCLHRTGTDPSMTGTRYATETWFFAPSAYPNPLEQVPLAL